MDYSRSETHQKPHAICIPLPLQSHIKAMLKLAKLLYHRGFYITFINTEFNHKRFLKSLGPKSLDGLPDFVFETIPDGLPPSDEDVTQDIPSLLESIRNNLMLPPFLDLLTRINQTSTATSSNPPVTCMVTDNIMGVFTVLAGEQLGIPVAMFISFSACGFLGLTQYPALIERGFAPLKDESYLTNGFLETIIDWIPGMKDIRLRDLPTFFRTTDPQDIMFNFALEANKRYCKASAIVIHTFDALERDVLDALSSIMPPKFYAIGPLQLLLNQMPEESFKQIGYSLWKEDSKCLQWLDTKPPNSVVYVNFGSITIISQQQLVEFAMGLANSKKLFLWIIRPDLVVGKSAVLPPEFEDQVKETGLIASWCPQEQVLDHPSIGGFLTHCGWNSILESLSAGVPMLCWPFFGDQQTNCRFICNEWSVGMEIDNDVKRDEVEKLVRELVEGEKGKELKTKAMEWKKLAHEATSPHGSSTKSFDLLVNQVLLEKQHV
ncbi:7-deoxyloganetin glucosyltransferase-like [Ziziphus jujuba]|uniref:Glycosyltransferase n=1 Tax=Ziziphus jujuba TaxID=326968 RepID=A0A6P3ZNJ3_ZIZJJ|nr:7-deoxyloganetin glucosyltransferase-like [Ziziphus jujuba]